MIARSAAQRRCSATAALIVLLCSATGCHNPIGENFSSADAIVTSDFWQDFVIIGAFGEPGPFELVEIIECDINEPCSFSHNDQNHTYDKFYGFRLVVLKLQTPGGDIAHVVLRSREKYPESS
jgi:hypothetical protein